MATQNNSDSSDEIRGETYFERMNISFSSTSAILGGFIITLWIILIYQVLKKTDIIVQFENDGGNLSLDLRPHTLMPTLQNKSL